PMRRDPDESRACQSGGARAVKPADRPSPRQSRRLGSPTAIREATMVDGVKALVFDVFGTVVDWRTSIIKDLEAFCRAKGIGADRVGLTDAWRAGYQPAMDKVRKGELGWTHIDVLHRMVLDELLVKFKLTGLSEVDKDHVNRVWHRLNGWPDAAEGLTRLKRK